MTPRLTFACSVAVPISPSSSVTMRVTVNPRPGPAYVWAACRVVTWALPSPKSQPYASMVPSESLLLW